MEKFDYQKICTDLISGLKEREKEIISRRFGLKGKERETLESVGKNFGICRERVRQIQKVSFGKIKPKTEKYQKVFRYFLNHLKNWGGLRKENVLLEELGGKIESNEVYFLLTLQEPFQRFNKNDDFYSLWTIDESLYLLAKKAINSVFTQLKKINKPLLLEKLNKSSLKEKALLSYLEVSKKIQKNEEDLYGLSDWPEINPRGIKDKAYLVFKKACKPLHFSEVSNLVKDSHVQTVHNELIKDNRFILVGRGIYALAEWGYYPGQVKDVIVKILQEAEESLTREEILEKVLKQRLIKKNTILLNLSNKQYFLKDSDGRYKINEA
ncbi:MAG: sigma factor-like helix-turn-helix DNA-binding protein [Candidatus Nealsonbacteria bacterium]